MREFPLFTAIYHGTVQLLRYRMVLLALLIVVELLPLLTGPYLLYLFSFNSAQETFTYWLHPWAYSQIVSLAFACTALSGRWHVRVGLALLAASWVWGAYMTGIQSSFWSIAWFGTPVTSLASQTAWLFACSTFIASLVVSVCGLELRFEPLLPRVGGPRRGQFSLAFLMTTMFVVGVTLLVLRAAVQTPTQWLAPKSLLAVTGWQLMQYSWWGLLGSVSMLAAVSSRRHWLWLLVLIAVAIISGMLLDEFSANLDGGWWMPLAIAVHPFLIASFLPRLGVQLPRVIRLDSLHRALASVR